MANSKPTRTLSAKEIVLAIHPSARVEQMGFSYFIKAWVRPDSGEPRDVVLGYGSMLEGIAWRDAARNMSDMTAPYTISRHPEYGWRWWDRGETLPAVERDIRAATDAETALIVRIRAAANRNARADKACAALRALMEGRDP